MKMTKKQKQDQRFSDFRDALYRLDRKVYGEHERPDGSWVAYFNGFPPKLTGVKPMRHKRKRNR